jgi:tetratricopeptide (TPR) repeat protein
MAKKRKARASKQATSTLVARADAHLAAGRYREAIDGYKQLLKREQRPEWHGKLTDAYLGRARQLADKGMYKEAAAMWENMENLCATHVHQGLYIHWLLSAGELNRAASEFTGADEAFRKSPEGRHVAERLANLLASGQTGIVKALDANSAIVRHHDSMAAAVKAYCEKDESALKESLKSLPVRSPYRDLRVILQALALLEADPQATQEWLSRLSEDSPLAQFATVVRTAALEAEAWLEACVRLDLPEQEFVFALKGWDARQAQLAKDLETLGVKQGNVRALFDFVCANSMLFEPSVVQHYCLGLLPSYPEGIPRYEQQFGALPPFELNRLWALSAEREGDLHRSLNRWEQCVHALTQSGDQGDDALRAALILRHMAELETRRYGPDPWDERIQEYLARSLQFDPEDKKTYLQLAEMARQREDRKGHDRWLEAAVKQFPHDAEVLMAVATAAYHRGAFKKAAGFAHTLIQRDPINAGARSLVISCHLAHARKQVTLGKYTLAKKELEIAQGVAREEEQRGVVALNQGFLALRTGLESSGIDGLQQAYQSLGRGPSGYLQFFVDGQRMGVESRALAHTYNQIKPKQPLAATKEDVLRLSGLLNRYLGEGVKGLTDLLQRLRTPLKAATKLNYSEQEMEAICDALERAEHYPLLKDYATTALTHWGQRPLFIYYETFGRSKGQADKLNSMDSFRLHKALDQALEDGDRRTVERIEDFLELSDSEEDILEDLKEGFDTFLEELMDQTDTDEPEEALEILLDRMRKAGLPVPPPDFDPRRRR